MTVKLRFAPSPTGKLHVGNARTALVNYLFCKSKNGEMLLRIDDTDQERSKPEYEKSIKEDLNWLGIFWEKTDRQSSRLKKYNEALSQLSTLNGSIYADRGIIMSGQIYEQFYGDPSKALEYYMRIINDYSDSIFSEPIRYHLRKMKKNEKI